MMSEASVAVSAPERVREVAALDLERTVEGARRFEGVGRVGGGVRVGDGAVVRVPDGIAAETLRRQAWEIGAGRAHAKYVCPDSYVNLCAVAPGELFLVWRLREGWVAALAERKREIWPGHRLIIRLYDVSFIQFNGFNAHRVRDLTIDKLAGERLQALALAGSTQIAEIGYLLRTGEFVPAARSQAVAFPSASVSANHDAAALYVDDRLVPEPVASPWEGASFLRERSKPRLRSGLRIAMLSFQAGPAAVADPIGTFLGSVGEELAALGLEVHAFVPRREGWAEDVDASRVSYHPLAVDPGNGQDPVAGALAFARALEERLAGLPSFDYFHVQEWMTGLVPWLGTRPATVALTSVEATRRNGTPVTPLSLQIEKLEMDVARGAECVIVPPGLREKALTVLGLDGARVHGFPMEGRPLDEWEMPCDLARAKVEIGLGASDRMLLFVGPLEWAAGPDLIVDALTTVVPRTADVRMVFVGCGAMRDGIAERAQRSGVGHAVRLLGHVELHQLIPLLRAAEGLLVPARQRVAQDEDVVALARRAGRPVLTTHGGPAHLVCHEHDGVVVYDNPPSLVWGMGRLLEDRRHAEEMGRNGLRQGQGASWTEVARAYADLCARTFAELREPS